MSNPVEPPLPSAPEDTVAASMYRFMQARAAYHKVDMSEVEWDDLPYAHQRWYVSVVQDMMSNNFIRLSGRALVGIEDDWQLHEQT